MLWFAVPSDIKRFRVLRYGRVLRGPVMMTPSEFNDRQAAIALDYASQIDRAVIVAPEAAEHFRDLAIYTSDDSGQAVKQIASSTNIKPMSVPALTEIELEGMGIGL
jgi:hypothetical protein